MAKVKMAGNLLKYLTKGLRGADGKISKSQLAYRLVPDLLYAPLAAWQTPGDIGDKTIAGASSLIGSSLGGLALSGLSRNQAVSSALDIGGSILGDQVAYRAGDQVMRVKDKIGGGLGETPYEKMSSQDRQLLAEKLKQQIMAQYGLIPGTREQYANLGGLGTGGIG